MCFCHEPKTEARWSGIRLKQCESRPGSNAVAADLTKLPERKAGSFLGCKDLLISLYKVF